jgi:signal transduction histidine kinase
LHYVHPLFNRVSMPESSTQIIGLTIIISTFLLLIVGALIVRYIFLFQRKRYQHQQELIEMRETFTQTLLQSKLEIQEQTLDHISKELHANFSHLVSLININLSEILPDSSAKMKENIIETKSLAKQLLSELKALSVSLNTDHIMHIGFVKALDNELGRLVKTKRYQVTFTKAGDEYRLSPEKEIILFRLSQEVLNNVLKYSKAKNIVATLIFSNTSFELKIADDGIGFDTELAHKQTAEKESTGLLNIQKRAKLINAVVAIRSHPGDGTEVQIIVPKES